MKVRKLKRRFSAVCEHTVQLKLVLPMDLINELRSRFRDPQAAIKECLQRAVERSLT